MTNDAVISHEWYYRMPNTDVLVTLVIAARSYFIAKPSKFGLNGLSEPKNELMVPKVPFQVLTNAGEF